MDKEQKKQILNEHYTPSSPAIKNYYHRIEIDNEFRDALDEKGLQLIVYGATGVGKTSLILSQLEKANETYLYFPLDTTITDANFCAKVMEKLGFKKISQQKTGQDSEFYSEGTVKGIVWGLITFGGKIGGKDKKIEEKVEIPYYNDADLDSVVEALKLLNCKLVLDDLEKAKDELKLPISHLGKKLSDVTATSNTSAKIIYAGITQEVSSLINVDESLRDRLAEQHIKLLETEEVQKILVSGWNAIDLKYDDINIEEISNLCCGFARYAHWLGKQAALSAINRDSHKIEKQDIDFAIEVVLNKYNSSFKEKFVKATGHKTGMRLREKILFAIASREEVEVDFKEIVRLCSQFEGSELRDNQISGPLGELKTEKRGFILESGKDGPKHRFKDLMMKPFVRIMMEQSKEYNKK